LLRGYCASQGVSEVNKGHNTLARGQGQQYIYIYNKMEYISKISGIRYLFEKCNNMLG